MAVDPKSSANQITNKTTKNTAVQTPAAQKAVWVGLALLVVLLWYQQVLLVVLLGLTSLAFGLSAVLLRVDIWRLTRTRVTTVAAAQTGLAAFRGKLVQATPVVAPLSGKPCQFFVITVRQQHTRLGRHRRVHIGTVTEVRSHQGFVPFSDGQQQCWLPAQFGYWDLPHQVTKTYAGQAVPESLWPWLTESQLALLSQPGHWHVTESRADAQDDLCAMGYFDKVNLDEPLDGPQPHGPTAIAGLLSLARDPLRLFRRRAPSKHSVGQTVEPALLPDPRFSVIEMPFIGQYDPDELAHNHQIATVALWGLCGLVAGIAIWLYHYL